MARSFAAGAEVSRSVCVAINGEMTRQWRRHAPSLSATTRSVCMQESGPLFARAPLGAGCHPAQLRTAKDREIAGRQSGAPAALNEPIAWWKNENAGPQRR